MKKQLFIIIVALFAISFSNVYGQLAPRTVTCLTANALRPVAGTPYTYEITVPGGPYQYTWFATQDSNFIVNGVLTLNRETLPSSAIIADTSTGYNNPLTGTVSVIITWKSFNASIPVFVVIQVKNTTGCNSRNMKVFKIAAQNAFTLDIANVNALKYTQTGYGTNIDRCISNIVSSVYRAGAPNDILNDFGADTLYYRVVAANWSEAWKPSVQLTNINALEHVTVAWAQDSTFASIHAMAGSGVGTGATPTIYTSAANVTPTGGVTSVGAAGQSIYIRVILDHSDMTNPSWEGLSAQIIALAVDGVTVPASGTGVGDIHYQAGASLPTQDCPWVDGYANDIATQTLLARPTINAVTPTPFLIIKP